MPLITIDGKQLDADAGLTIMQVCNTIGTEIPHFCYHEYLSIPGNCRMCMVEVKGMPKLVTACSTPIAEGMEIYTQGASVDKARQDVMALLLINHPLDCPICDQGGECDLQDQAMKYGLDKSLFHEEKRAVTNKNFGPLIDGHMTRCIQCTRCIRFVEEVAGTPVLGGIGRGDRMEISSYVGSAINSELSGNLVDVCPVGALVNKPYSFKARPWELKSVQTIDVMDAVGSHTRIDVRGLKPLRILPIRHDDINEVWLADKGRHCVDGAMRQRIDVPWMRDTHGKLVKTSWDDALKHISKKIKSCSSKEIGALSGDLATVEGMAALKDMLDALNVYNRDCRPENYQGDVTTRGNYLFNTTIAGIEQADACLIIGSNPRIEAPIINARLRKRYLQDNFTIGVIGEEVDLTYKHTHIGSTIKSIHDILEGAHPFSNVLKNAKNPMVIVGQGALTNNDAKELQGLLGALVKKYNMVRSDWNGYNVLHTDASQVGGLDIGFTPTQEGLDTYNILKNVRSNAIKCLILLGADNIDTAALDKAFVIYIGHHGDKGAQVASVILPSTSWLEHEATYVNTEGRVQETQIVLPPLGQAKPEWEIITSIAKTMNIPMYETLQEVRIRMQQINPVFKIYHTIQHSSVDLPLDKYSEKNKEQDNTTLKSPINDYYRTNAVARASVVLAECSETFTKNKLPKSHGREVA